MENNVIDSLLAETYTIHESHEQKAIATGERFNIFSLLNRESDEVVTHSKFIGELLNIKGSHGQKDKFLKLFVDLLHKPLKFDTGSSRVYIEHHVGKVEDEHGGRIDIMLKDNDGNVIMIENKIYAKEQPKQLLRYRNAYPNGHLIYLTRFGEQSTCSSSEGTGYIKICYKTKILQWLHECKVASANLPVVSETITQYINLVKKLTNQNHTKNMNKEVISHILKNEENLTAYKVLFDVKDELKKELVKSIILKMVERIRHLDVKIEVMDFTADKGLLFALQNDDLDKHEMKLRLNFEGNNYSNLIIGFYNVGIKKQNTKLAELVAKEYGNGNGNVKQTVWYPAYIEYAKYRNWYFGTLNKIRFDKSDAFYDDFTIKVTTLLKIFNEYSEYIANSNNNISEDYV